MASTPAYDFDLDHQLATVIDNYQQDRETFWQQQSIESSGFEQADAFARSFLEAAEDLVSRSASEEEPREIANQRRAYLQQFSNWRQEMQAALRGQFPEGQVPASILEHINDFLLAERPGANSSLKLVWERLCIDLAWDAVKNRLTQGANRLLQLMGVCIDAEPSARVIQFLMRVSRCFIWGFNPECVILCRGVIDSTFRDAVSDAICIKHNEKPARYGFTLTNRIRAARAENLIGDDVEKAAWEVNTRGTKAAHYDPHATADVLGTIKDVLVIVQKLAPANEE